MKLQSQTNVEAIFSTSESLSLKKSKEIALTDILRSSSLCFAKNVNIINLQMQSTEKDLSK